MERPEDNISHGVLVTGGRDASFKSLSSVEFFGPKSCSVPALPGPRSGHVTFVTGHQTVATCGGWTGAAREMSSQCLVLNLTYGKGGEWQKGVMGDLLLNQSVTSCPSIEGPPCVFPFIDSMYKSKPFLGDVNLLWRIKDNIKKISL